MIRVSFANQKGGVGKTTVTLGFAEAAFLCGKKVLVVDCDPQANATTGLGIEQTYGAKSIVDILRDEIELDDDNCNDYIVASPWNSMFGEIDLRTNSLPCIDVIPSNGLLGSVEALLASDPIGACDRLDIALKNVSKNYDYVFFDCPPSMGLLTINALYASDQVIIVSGPSAWSSDGVSAFKQNVARISKRLGGRPQLSAIVVNNVGRTRDAKYWQSEIIDASNLSNLPVQSISSRAAVAEAGAMSQPLTSLGRRDGAQTAIDEFAEAFKHILNAKVAEEKKIKLVNY